MSSGIISPADTVRRYIAQFLRSTRVSMWVHTCVHQLISLRPTLDRGISAWPVYKSPPASTLFAFLPSSCCTGCNISPVFVSLGAFIQRATLETQPNYRESTRTTDCGRTRIPQRYAQPSRHNVFGIHRRRQHLRPYCSMKTSTSWPQRRRLLCHLHSIGRVTCHYMLS